MQEPGTADAKCITQERKLRKDANDVLKSRTATAHEMNLRFARVIKRPQSFKKSSLRFTTRSLLQKTAMLGCFYPKIYLLRRALKVM